MDAANRQRPSNDGRSFTVADATGSMFIAGSLVIVTSVERATTRTRRGALRHAAAAPARAPHRVAHRRRARHRAQPSVRRGDGRGGRPATIEALHATTGALLEVGANLTEPGRPGEAAAASLQPAHLLVRAERIGKDLRARRGARTAHRAHRAAGGDLRPELRLRAARRAQPRGERADRPRRSPNATSACSAPAARATRACGPGSSTCACPRRRRCCGSTRSPIATSTTGSCTCEDLVDASALDVLLPMIRGAMTARSHPLAERIENLGVLDWEVWAGERTAVTDVVAERPDATVLDLGGFSTPEQQLVVALSLLDDLWERREERRPVLLVIDEAHNLCSPRLDSPLAVAVRERIVQIAAEGRKFGLWLLLSTQRPSKVHPGIISQCDNLALMKMTLAARPRRARHVLRLRAGVAARPVAVVPPGRGAVRRRVRADAVAREDERAAHARGRQRRAACRCAERDRRSRYHTLDTASRRVSYPPFQARRSTTPGQRKRAYAPTVRNVGNSGSSATVRNTWIASSNRSPSNRGSCAHRLAHRRPRSNVWSILVPSAVTVFSLQPLPDLRARDLGGRGILHQVVDRRRSRAAQPRLDVADRDRDVVAHAGLGDLARRSTGCRAAAPPSRARRRAGGRPGSAGRRAPRRTRRARSG